MPPDAAVAVGALQTLRLGLYLLLNVIAIIICAVYSSLAHSHIDVWSPNRGLFNFPALKLHEEKLGYGAVRFLPLPLLSSHSIHLTYPRPSAAQSGAS